MTITVMADDNNFEQEVLGHDGPVMTEFFATWCPHCQRMQPVIEEIAAEYKGKVKVCLADIDIALQKTEEYAIESTPTIIFFKDGEETAKLVGEQSIEKLRRYMDELLLN